MGGGSRDLPITPGELVQRMLRGDILLKFKKIARVKTKPADTDYSLAVACLRAVCLMTEWATFTAGWISDRHSPGHPCRRHRTQDRPD